MINSVGSNNNLFQEIGKAVGNAVAAKGGNPVETLKSAANMMEGLSGLLSGSTGGKKVASMADLFGTSFDKSVENQRKVAAKAAAGGAAKGGAANGAAAGGGAPMSLGALLAMVGGLLVKSMEATMKQLADAAKQLDATTTSGGPTAAQNQKIQEMTFNLQQIQQTLNRVNETVTNLSRSQSEAQKSTAQNLSV